MVSFLAVTLFPLLMIISATNDVLTQRIPNALTLAMALSFPVAALASGLDWRIILLHVATAAGVFVPVYMLFLGKVLGGGDAKLVAAAALWFGPGGLVSFIMLMVLAGGVIALVIFAWSTLKIDAELRGSVMTRLLQRLKLKIPYGFGIAAGALLAFPNSWMSAINLS